MTSLIVVLAVAASLDTPNHRVWVPLPVGPPAPRLLFLDPNVGWIEPECEYVDVCHWEGYYYVNLLQTFTTKQRLEDETTFQYLSKVEVWALNCAFGWGRTKAIFYYPEPMGRGDHQVIEDYARVGLRDAEHPEVLHPEVSAVCAYLEKHGPNNALQPTPSP